MDESWKNLGHLKEPKYIKCPKQFPVSLETAITTSESIFAARVTWQELLIFYQGMYQPKVEYLLGQTFLSDKQVNKIKSTLIPKVIAKYGYNRNIHLGIWGGPKKLGAVGFYPFKTIIKW